MVYLAHRGIGAQINCHLHTLLLAFYQLRVFRPYFCRFRGGHGHAIRLVGVVGKIILMIIFSRVKRIGALDLRDNRRIKYGSLI